MSWTAHRLPWVFCAFFLAIGVEGATNYVSVGGTGDGSGSDWANTATLTNALAAAADGDALWVATGVYSNANDPSFTVTNNITIYGGFTNGMATLAERDWEAHPVQLDGGAARRVLTLSSSCTLDGIVVTNGYAVDGGAVYASGAYTVNVYNCRFTDNRMSTVSGSQGGAFYLSGGTALMTNTVFDGNGDNCPGYCGGSRHGQAIYAINETLTITDCAFTNNRPLNTYASRGGGGGAIFIAGTSSLTVEDTDFIDNSSPSTSNNGGGAASVNGGDAAFRRCLFRRNGAGSPGSTAAQPEEGGALWIGSSGNSIVIERCIFEQCNAGASSSTTADGGAIAVINGNVSVTNCTFSGNSCKDQGGALYVEGGTLTVVNSIVHSNAAPTRGDDIGQAGGSATISYSRLGGTGLANVYDVGGLTLSNVHTNDPLFADAANGDFHLKSASGRYDPGTMSYVTSDPHPRSPCIDAGDPDHAVADEPSENGSRVNQGRYGGTAEASKSPAVAPEIENRDNTVNNNIVDVRGELVNNDAIAQCTLYYGTNNPPTTGSDFTMSMDPPQQTGTVFEVRLGGLLYATTYYYQWYATNAVGDDFANTVSNFTTGAEPPGGGSHIIHVKKDAAGGETGDNWFNAFTSLADAMAAVNAGTNEIWVAAETYDDATVTITTNVSIYGGFDGTETNRTDREVSANRSAIDGAGERRCFYITGGTVVFDGLTITNGMANGAPVGDELGAGIYAVGGTFDLILNNCRVERCFNNTTTASGMGLYASGGTVLLTNTLFSGNGSIDHGNHGMGVWSSGTEMTVVDCVFSNQGAVAFMRASSGGALRISGGTLGVTNCVFVDNRIGPGGATSDTLGGGAIWLGGGVVYSIRNCIFRDNSVFHGSQNSYGGTFSVQGSTTTGVVENCTIVESKADKYGGAIWVKAGYMTLKNCILWTNTTRELGYDLATGGGNAIVSYCNLSGDKDSATNLFQSLGTLTKGSGLQWVDPLFASPYDDLHLQSEVGRWDPGTTNFVIDGQTSFCIDKGEPGGASTYTNEALPNGDRINLGAYGNTTQASKTLVQPVPVVTNWPATVTNNYVTLKGELIDVDTTAEIFIYYGIGDSGESFSGWIGAIQPTPVEQQTGTVFEASVGDLLYNTTYTFRCFATNASGHHWAQNPLTVMTQGEPPGGPPEVLHVKNGAAGTQSGATWFDACHTLAAALALVDGPTNEIWVANRSEVMVVTLAIATNVNIYGGFIGDPNSGETLRTQRSLTNATLLDGQGERRVVHVTAGTVLLDGITITNGFYAPSAGYGLRAEGSYNLTLANCHVTRNGRTDGDDGAGAYFGGGTVLVTNSTFTENGFGHSIQGGGIYASGASLAIVDSVFTNNGTPGYGGRGGDGGAVYLSGGSLVVTRTEFISNHVGTDGNVIGGAVGVVGAATAAFTNCAFRQNTCTWQDGRGDGGNGAAMALSLSAGYTAVVENCTLAYNTGANRGGGLYILGGTALIKNSIFWSNAVSTVVDADAEGAEIYASGASTTVDVSHCDFTGTNGNYVITGNTNTVVTFGQGIIMTDPLFASANDLHLRSAAGRWDPMSGQWVNDTGQTSPGIDAGDRTSAWALEPQPNGSRINLGAYGNTIYASKTLRGGTLLIIR